MFPDLPALSASHELAQDQYERAHAKWVGPSKDQEPMSKLKANLEKMDQKLKEAEYEYGVIGNLSGIANGQNAKGMTFHRFVLTALLDDVLIAATERLQRMSRG